MKEAPFHSYSDLNSVVADVEPAPSSQAKEPGKPARIVVKNEKSVPHEANERLANNANRLKSRVVSVMSVDLFPGVWIR